MVPKNKFEIKGDVVWITLTRGFKTQIDLADWPEVQKCRWLTCTSKTSGPYAVHHKRTRPALTATLLQRFLTGGESDDVDHANGDGLNNRRYNLRPCSRAQNQANAQRSSRNTSGYKGVSWHKGGGSWRAYIRIRGRLKSLGSFSDPVDAAKAYDTAAVAEHGIFARGNFTH